jgi:DNA-binding PadR family transcriptional regulator
MSNTDPRSLLPLTHLSYQVLLALADVDRHGYGIIKEVSARTDGEMVLETGTLYTALKRLKDERLIHIVEREERPPEEDDRRRIYRLTPFGKKVLGVESQRLARLVGVAMEKRVLPVMSK